MTKTNTEVLVLWNSDQDGYGTDLRVFSSDADLLDHLRERLEADVLTHAEHRRPELREAAAKVAEAAIVALADGGEWEFNGNQDHEGLFEGTHFKAKWCAVGG